MQGLLTQKVIHKQDHISAINRSSDLYHRVAPSRATPQSMAAGATAASSSPQSHHGNIEVSYRYRWPPRDGKSPRCGGGWHCFSRPSRNFAGGPSPEGIRGLSSLKDVSEASLT